MIIFNKITKDDIFQEEFKNLTANNVLEFSKQGIVVIYGPNGVGKSSLVSLLKESDNDTHELSFTIDSVTHLSGSDLFHVVSDQNNRNAIRGSADEFLLGDNIAREFELEALINTNYEKHAGDLITLLKEHGIRAANSYLFSTIVDEEIQTVLKDFANTRSKGSNSKSVDSLSCLQELKEIETILSEEEEAQLSFFISDYNKQNESLLAQVENLVDQVLPPTPKIDEVEEHTHAIALLNRFPTKTQCIVCDTVDIDPITLLKNKIERRKRTLAPLNKDQRTLIERILELVPSDDVFCIKETLLQSLRDGDTGALNPLVEKIEAIKEVFTTQLLSKIGLLTQTNDLIGLMNQLAELQEEQPVLTDEDLIFIQNIINSSLDRELEVKRMDDKKFVITLGNTELLETEREDLPLSSGEQNFISLAFEFLRAKNVDKEYVVIDDPVSSFDSIYKNRVAYAIVSMLESKKQIILTHNLDLIGLLDAQHSYCHTLYLLNNTEGAENGFIKLNKKEQKILTDLSELLKTFREKVFPQIKNPKYFLYAMIPFMRGYANIIGDTTKYGLLCSLMHGDRTEQVDIGELYQKLFGCFNQAIPQSLIISVPELLNEDLANLPQEILCSDQYPLLNKTLRHSFTYLYLRLLVEKHLLNIIPPEQRRKRSKLGQLISDAYPRTSETTKEAQEQRYKRAFLTSKKTLMNEFNHFESNLSIFQPAIDISDSILAREAREIVEFVLDQT